MRPPTAQANGPDAATPVQPAVSVLLRTLTQRSDFVRASQARRQSTAGFTLQARPRADDDPSIRVGFTCSKKIGNAVTRNRAKRRLRAVAAAVLPRAARPGWDYVLVGRPGATVERPFALMIEDLETAVGRVTAPRSAK